MLQASRYAVQRSKQPSHCRSVAQAVWPQAAGVASLCTGAAIAGLTCIAWPPALDNGQASGSPHACPRMQVVPFSPSAGLLQWVEQTLPIMEWLCGETRTSGGHVRYGDADDYTYVEAQTKLAGAAAPEKRHTLADVYKDVSPALWPAELSSCLARMPNCSAVASELTGDAA